MRYHDKKMIVTRLKWDVKVAGECYELYQEKWKKKSFLNDFLQIKNIMNLTL